MNTAVACISQLTALLQRETDAFDRMDTTLVASLGEEKRRLVEWLGQLASEGSLRGEPNGRAAIVELLTAAEANSRSCDRAITVQRILVGMVGSAAGRATPTGRYGQRGKLTSSPKPSALAMLSQA